MSQSPDIMPDPESGLASAESMRLVQRAILNKWDIKPEWKELIPRVAMQILADPNRKERDRLRAMELIRALERDNLDAAIALDKITRLDQGKATENTRVTVDYGEPGKQWTK